MERSAETEEPPLKKAAKKYNVEAGTEEPPAKESCGPKKATLQAPKVAKQSPPKTPVACIISGLHTEGKIAVARCLLQELETSWSVVLATDAAAAKQALPGSKVRRFADLSKSAGLLAKSLAMDSAAFASLAAASFADWDVLRASFAASPAALKTLAAASFASFLPPNVVAIAHELAQPEQITSALAGAAGAVRLVAVVDGRSFLDDLDSGASVPKELTKASPNEVRTISDVLAEHVGSADVIVLATSESSNGEIDEDELAMIEDTLSELNPSATLLRRAEGGAGGGPLLQHILAAEGPTALAETLRGWFGA